jgi:hypothetical protein
MAVATTAVNLAMVTPSGWNVGRAGASGSVYCFWKISDGTETSINFTFTPGALRMNCIQLAGAHASAPFDTSGVAEGVASTNSVATVTDAAMAVNDEYAVAMAGQSATNNDTETATNSFTTINTGNARDVGAQRIYSGSGSGTTASTTLGWTTASAARWIIAAFKPAAAGGPPVFPPFITPDMSLYPS